MGQEEKLDFVNGGSNSSEPEEPEPKETINGTPPDIVLAPDNQEVPGLGLTRKELLDYLKAHSTEAQQRPAFLKYLYDVDDWLNVGALITENTPRMVATKVRLKVILAASDPKREKPLIQVFLEEYNREMVALMRQGRQEALGALQALAEAGGGEEPGISLGR